MWEKENRQSKYSGPRPNPGGPLLYVVQTGGKAQHFSKMVATPIPPPMHMVTSA